MGWERSIQRRERRRLRGQKTYSEIFAESLTKLANTNDKVVAITAAMPNGTALDLFRPHHPKRYFDVGIAEEHAVLFAAGMATKGYRPFCAIYSTFLQRAFDQVVHDVALQELPVVFCMDRGGLSGDDGPTHHGLFDISYLRGIPNMIHMDPKDEDELQDMMQTALEHDGPSAIRYPRGDRAGDCGEGCSCGAGDRQGRSAAGWQRCCGVRAWEHGGGRTAAREDAGCRRA